MSARMSEGVSLKAPGLNDYHSHNTSFGGSKLGYYGVPKTQDDDDADSCCMNQCEAKTKCCGNKLSCFCFKRRDDCCLCGVITIMLIALFVGVLAPLAMNALIDSEINSELIIDSTSAPSYAVWQTNAQGEGTKTKINFDLYFFDFQNPVEILSGAKPVVVEKGPYAYNEYFYKFDIEWSDDGDLVTFNNQRYFVFDAARTGKGLNEDDVLTLPYATVMGFQYLLSKIPVEATELMEVVMENATTAKYENMTATLRELKIAILLNNSITRPDKLKDIAAINKIQDQLDALYAELMQFMNASNPALLVTKAVLSMSPYGVSPFFTKTPGEAYFGWLNDPVLTIVQYILNGLQAKKGIYVPWTSAVSGAVTNYTTIADARRRKTRDTLHTGKKNIKQVMQYVKFWNSSQVWSCVSPTSSQDPSEYNETKQFPACKHFQSDWNDTYAEKMGYAQPYATPYANRVEGSNAELYGRPVTTDYVQIFIGDIYRSAYAEKTGVVTDLYDLTLFRYQLQQKDLWNETKNPANWQYYNNAPNGMGNLTGAVNAPVWISNPHFTDCDESLINSIDGIHPNASTHRTYLDVEPQTGQLVRGFKALQENWRVTSQKFPTASPDLLVQLNDTCLQMQRLQRLLIFQDNKLFPNNTQIIDCNLTTATFLLTALSINTDWNLYEDVMYWPFAYCEEYNEITQDDAEELKSSLYDTEEFLTQVTRVCFYVALACVLYIGWHVYYFKFSDPASVFDGAVPRSVSACDDVEVASKLLAEKTQHQQPRGNLPSRLLTDEVKDDHGLNMDAARPLLADS